MGISWTGDQWMPSVEVDMTRSSSLPLKLVSELSFSDLSALSSDAPPGLQFASNWQSTHTRYTLPEPSIAAVGRTLPVILATTLVLLQLAPPSVEMKESMREVS